MKNLILLLMLSLGVLIISYAQTIPQKMNYQGVLMDGSGVILSDGSYSLTFKLYNAASGGSALWTETKSVTVQDGVFATQLGSTTPITLPFTEGYYLGVAVATGSELTPRFPLSSVPYSFMSLNVPDGSITAAKISKGEVIKSLNGLKDAVTLVAGSNVTITPSGNNLTISSTGGGGGGISGSGTTNYIPLFTGATTLGNSVLFQTGGNIGIGTTNPGAKLEVNGGDALINGLTIGRGSGNSVSNSAFGNGALYSNTTGTNNTANGYEVLFSNTTGTNNTANGYRVLNLNSTGSFNTASGFAALYSNTTGSYNTANGDQALNRNTIGNANTANGYQALFYNTTGFDNTANGDQALFYNTTGAYNTANGRSALSNNTTGSHNIANGYQALYLNTTGIRNTANGDQALFSNTTGNVNTANGYVALYFNSTGSYNTASGYGALYLNSTGNFNTANGRWALYNASTGFQNTSVGANSMLTTTTGSYNTALGYNTGPNGAAFYNTTCLGIDATATGNNMVRIGNTFVTSIGGQVGWTTLSDARFKENVNEDVPGLSFITQLRPVTYQINRDAFDTFTKVYEKNINGDGNETPIEQRMQSSGPTEIVTGFLAQEVEQIANNLGYDFSGIDKPENSNDYYGLRYGEFVAPLVKAVQEQQKIIEELTRRIEALEGR